MGTKTRKEVRTWLRNRGEEIPKWLRTSEHSGPHHIYPQSHKFSDPRSAFEKRWNGMFDEAWNIFKGIPDDRFWRPENHDICHPAWHILSFGYIPTTFIAVLRNWTGKRGGLRRDKLSTNQRLAWDILFESDTRVQEAISWIEEHFVSIERRFEKSRQHPSSQSPNRRAERR